MHIDSGEFRDVTSFNECCVQFQLLTELALRLRLLPMLADSCLLECNTDLQQQHT